MADGIVVAEESHSPERELHRQSAPIYEIHVDRIISDGGILERSQDQGA